MSLYAMPYNGDDDAPKALVMFIRRPGQRWHSLLCFGRKGHYYEDGGCEHTDDLLSRLTEYGRKVTKLDPFGGKPEENRPKRFAKRPDKGEADAAALTQGVAS